MFVNMTKKTCRSDKRMTSPITSLMMNSYYLTASVGFLKEKISYYKREENATTDKMKAKQKTQPIYESNFNFF